MMHHQHARRQRTHRGAARAAAIVMAALLLLACPAAEAVIVIPKGSDEPVYGFLVSRNAARVVVDEALADGTTRRRSFSTNEIDLIQETVDADKLQTLRPDTPRGYRDYADDLREKRRDPDARRTAMRLYLIAAHLRPQELGRGCLLAATDLAENAEQQRRYRAMAYLLDPTHDASLLKPPEVESSSGLTAAQRAALLRGLQAVRSGRKSVATRTAQQAEFRAGLAHFPHLLTLEQFNDAVALADRDLPNHHLRRVLALELELSPAASRRAASSDRETWSESALKTSPRVAELTLQAIAPFDPRNCFYWDGRWQAEPPAASRE